MSKIEKAFKVGGVVAVAGATGVGAYAIYNELDGLRRANVDLKDALNFQGTQIAGFDQEMASAGLELTSLPLDATGTPTFAPTGTPILGDGCYPTWGGCTPTPETLATPSATTVVTDHPPVQAGDNCKKDRIDGPPNAKIITDSVLQGGLELDPTQLTEEEVCRWIDVINGGGPNTPADQQQRLFTAATYAENNLGIPGRVNGRGAVSYNFEMRTLPTGVTTIEIDGQTLRLIGSKYAEGIWIDSKGLGHIIQFFKTDGEGLAPNQIAVNDDDNNVAFVNNAANPSARLGQGERDFVAKFFTTGDAAEGPTINGNWRGACANIFRFFARGPLVKPTPGRAPAVEQQTYFEQPTNLSEQPIQPPVYPTNPPEQPTQPLYPTNPFQPTVTQAATQPPQQQITPGGEGNTPVVNTPQYTEAPQATAVQAPAQPTVGQSLPTDIFGD